MYSYWVALFPVSTPQLSFHTVEKVFHCVRRKAGEWRLGTRLSYWAQSVLESRYTWDRVWLTLTVESAFPDTRMFFFSSMPLVRDWWPGSKSMILDTHMYMYM